MKKLYLLGFVFFSLLSLGISAEEIPRFIRKNPYQVISLPKTVSVSNGIITAQFAPDSMGRMTSLNVDNKEILQRFERKSLVGNPLFAPKDCNVFGFRELLWRTPMATLDLPVTLVEKKDNSIIFSTNSYGNTPLKLYRKATLRANSSIVDFEVTFSNLAAKSYTYQLWLNLLPLQPYLPIIPLYDGIKSKFNLGNNFFQPATNWNAAFVPKANSVIAIAWNKKDMRYNGEIYVHGAQDFTTLEAVLGSRTLKKDQRLTHNYKILVFKGIKQINALANETAISVTPKDKEFELTFCPASPTNLVKGKLYFSNFTLDINIPPLKTNQLYKIVVPQEPNYLIINNQAMVEFFSSNPPKKQIKIVAFGDSITEGLTKVKLEDNWLLKLGLKLGGNYKLYNAGVGGNSAREAMKRYQKDVLDKNPDVILLEFGGNNHDPSPLRKHRRVSDKEFLNLLNKFKAKLPRHCKVVMVTFPPIINEKHLYFKQVPGGKVDEELHSQREIVRKFAQENNYPLLDLYKLILPNKEELISSDGIHLSAKGHTFFAQEMEKVLRKYKIVK